MPHEPESHDPDSTSEFQPEKPQEQCNTNEKGIPKETIDFVASEKPKKVVADVRDQVEKLQPEDSDARSLEKSSEGIADLTTFTKWTGILVSILGRHTHHTLLEAIERIVAAKDNSVHTIAESLVEQGILTHEQAAICMHPESNKIGQCQILSSIGKGGMAEVYLGHNNVLDRTVAVKIPSLETTDPERFLQEARSAATLKNHRHLAQVYEAGTGEFRGKETPYYTMEYVEGENLETLKKGLGPMSVAHACAVAEAAAKGLAAAHVQRIIHRDVKPSNLVLANDPQDPNIKVVKVIDFGIARKAHTYGEKQAAQTSEISGMAAPDLTQGGILGTPHYMSPEQCTPGKSIDPGTDVYSLGVTLFEFLADRPPYQGTLAQILTCHTNPAITPPPLPPHVPSDLARYITQEMMAHDPANRPTMEECRRMLYQYVEHPTGLKMTEKLGTFLRTSTLIRRLIGFLSFNRKAEKTVEADRDPTQESTSLDQWEKQLLSGIEQPKAKTEQQTLDTLAQKFAAGDIREKGLHDTTQLLSRSAVIVEENEDASEETGTEFPYRITRILGGGSMGTVYEAIDDTGVTVAVKVMSSDLLGRARESALFQRERELGEMFREVKVGMPVKVHDSGTLRIEGIEKPVPYIVMDLIPGNNLEDICRNQRPSCAQAVAVSHHLALGLARDVHPHLVLHRDIKPSNVMIEHDGTVRLTDFGLAHLHFQDTIGKAKWSVVGTPEYTAPEVIESGKIAASERSDIYNCGCTLFYLLAGKSPYAPRENEQLIQAIRRAIESPIPSIAEHVADRMDAMHVEPLENIIRKALAKNPGERYDKASAFAADLEKLLQAMQQTEQETRAV